MKKPPRLRWQEDADGLGGTLRSPWTAQAAWILGAFWNGGLALLRFQKGGDLTTVGLVACAVFTLLFLRGMFSGTRVRFADGKLVCTRGPIFPRKTVTHDLSDIGGFLYVAKEGDERKGHDIYMETRAGVRIALPLVIDGLVVQVRALQTTNVGAAPSSHADFLCSELARMLEDARHRGGSYRIAPGAEAATEEPVDPDSEERRRRVS